MNMQQLGYTLRMNVANFKRDISNIWFTIRFSFYKWYYKGGANIPPDVVGTLLLPPSPEEERASIALTETYIALKEVCSKFNIDYTNTDFFIDFSLMIHGQLESAIIDEELEIILNSNQKRMAVYLALAKRGDISTSQVSALRQSIQWNNFYVWLQEEPTGK